MNPRNFLIHELHEFSADELYELIKFGRQINLIKSNEQSQIIK
jgi:hypothetical protein